MDGVPAIFNKLSENPLAVGAMVIKYGIDTIGMRVERFMTTREDRAWVDECAKAGDDCEVSLSIMI